MKWYDIIRIVAAVLNLIAKAFGRNPAPKGKDLGSTPAPKAKGPKRLS